MPVETCRNVTPHLFHQFQIHTAFTFLRSSLHAQWLCISPGLLYRVSPNCPFRRKLFNVVESQKDQAPLSVPSFTIVYMSSAEAFQSCPVLVGDSNTATHHPHIKGKKRGAHAGGFSLKPSLVLHLAQTSYSLSVPGSLIT